MLRGILSLYGCMVTLTEQELKVDQCLTKTIDSKLFSQPYYTSCGNPLIWRINFANRYSCENEGRKAEI